MKFIRDHSQQEYTEYTATDNQDVLFSFLVNDGSITASIFSRRTWGTQQLTAKMCCFLAWVKMELFQYLFLAGEHGEHSN